MDHCNIEVSKKDYSQEGLQENIYFAEFRILQL